MNELANIVQERLSQLPDVIREIILNSDWIKKVADICKENKLLLDQETQIENMTIMIMVGVLDPRKTLSELTEMGIGQEKAVIITQELQQKIFSPIMSDLVEVFESFEELDSAESENKQEIKTSNYILKANSVGQEESREEILKQIEDEDKQNNNIINFIKEDSEIIKKTEDEKKVILEKLNSPFSSKEENLSLNKTGNTQSLDPYREIPE